MTTYIGDHIDVEDSFVSERIRDNLRRKEKMEKELIENEGKHIFYRDVLLDLNDNIVSTKLIPTRYGSAFLVNEKWINPHVRPTTLAKKGYKFGMQKYTAPAAIRLFIGGSGMYGVYNSCYDFVPAGSDDDIEIIETTLHSGF